MSEQAGLDIASGSLSGHESDGSVGNVLQPLSDTGAGISALANPTLIVPGQLTPADQGGVFDTTGMFQSQMASGAAVAAAAMSSGMTADGVLRQHYEATLLPLGASYGDLIQFPAAGEDPGAGVGNTLPTLAFYDPPRGYGGAEGAPGYTGLEPPPGYQAAAQ